MGLKDLKRRLTASVEELDNARLHDRYSGLGITEIGAMAVRTPVRVGGEVQRLRVVPRAGSPSIEAVLSDGTGEVDGRVHGPQVDRWAPPGTRACSSKASRTPSGAGS